MDHYRSYYLKKMGYTVWRTRSLVSIPDSCQCLMAKHDFGDTNLLCVFDKTPTKYEKDLWLFLSMAFNFDRQHYVTASQPSPNTACMPCLEYWLNRSRHHQSIFFGVSIKEIKNNTQKKLLCAPSLNEMLLKPFAKKKCFIDIQQFLCQQDAAI